MSEWKPIESAPKDGRHILIVCGRTRLGFYHPADKRWREYDGTGYGLSLDFTPSHWMPLPEPPKEG